MFANFFKAFAQILMMLADFFTIFEHIDRVSPENLPWKLDAERIICGFFTVENAFLTKEENGLIHEIGQFHSPACGIYGAQTS